MQPERSSISYTRPSPPALATSWPVTSGKPGLAWPGGFIATRSSNTLAIFLQCPEATQVAGYRAWQEMGRQVRKGEHGITILAPIKRRVTAEGESGESATEAEAVTVRQISGFTTTTVFDISQTDGEPIPERPRPKLLTGAGPRWLWEALEAQVTAAGYPVELVGPDKLGPANGRTHAGGLGMGPK